jgi:D-alanyl-D-alanine carboxypeptidase (penicillin-binding protein 5/6)
MFAGVSFAEEDFSVPPEIKSASAIVMKSDTGQVLYEKEPDIAAYPASITKIMTALLVLEKLPLDQVLTMDEEVEAVNEAQIYLRTGEEITVRDLLYAMMLASANDAAVALAKGVSGSVPNFAAEMNAKAKEIGATATNFVNPNGLPDPAHVTTARDFALITKEAMKNDSFRQIVQSGEYTIPKNNKNWERRVVNTHELLFSYPGTNGVKTGTLDDTKTLVTSANRDGRELIVVVMGGTPYNRDVYTDTEALLNYGFYGFTDVQLFTPDVCSADIAVTKGQQEKTSLVVKKPVIVCLPNASVGQITYAYDVPESVAAPVEKGAKIGKVKAMLGETQLAERNLIADAGVAKTLNLFERAGLETDSVVTIIKIIAAVIILIIIIFIIVLIRARRDNINRRTKRMRWGKASAIQVKRVKRIK